MYIAPKNANTSGFNADNYLKLREQRLGKQATANAYLQALRSEPKNLADAYMQAAQKQSQPQEEKDAAVQSSADTYAANYLKLREQRLANQNAPSQTQSAPSSTDFANNAQNTLKTVSSDLIATSFADESNVARLNAEKLAREAQQEYEAAKSQEQYSGHAAVVNMAAAAQPGSTYNLPQQEQESDELRALRERAEAAEKEAQRAQQDYRLSQDRKTYEQDMQKIQALSSEARSALDTYAQLSPLARNAAMQSRYLSAQRVLRQAGLSDEQMNALAETWARMENAETMAQKQQEYAQAAEENPLLHNVLSVPAGIAGAISGTGAVLSEAVGRLDGSRYSTLDPNLPGYSPSVYTGTVRQTTTQNIDDGTVLGKAGATLYGASMSAADNLARIVTLGPTGSLALAGMSSFQDSVRDVTTRGGTPAQAYAMGVATAGLEVLTEKVSLDSLISTKTPESITQLLKNAAIQGGIEVSEEELNFAGGLIADAVIMGGNSEFDRTVADLVAGGMSAEEAKRQALMNNLNQAVNVAAQSFLSGGLMSGAQSAAQMVINGGFSTPQSTTEAPAEQNPVQAEPPVQTAPVAPTQSVQESMETPAQSASDEAYTREYLRLRAERLAQQANAAPVENAEIQSAAQNSGSRKTYPLNAYSQHQKENWKNSKRIVLFEGVEQFRRFIQNALTGKQQTNSKMYFGSVSSDLAAQISSKTGYDVEGYNLSLGENEIRKIKKSHGNETTESKRGQRAVTEADYLKIPDVVQSPDSISLSPKSYEGKPVIEFRQRNGNELTTVAAVVSDKRLDLFVQTTYINKKGSIATPESVQADSITPKTTGGTAPTTMVTENSQNVNGQSVPVRPDESVGAAPQGFDPYTNLQYEYGNQPDRANDFRPVNVPKRDTYGRNVSEFAANAYGSEYIPDSFIPELEQLVVEGALGHDTRTNEESFRAAAREIEERGEARSKNDITKAVTSGEIGENDVAKALSLLKHYANKTGVRAKAAAREMCINVSQLATRSARDLQLFSTLRSKSPMGAAVEAVTTIEAFQPYSIANRFRKDKDFSQWKKDTQDAVIDMATQIDNVPEGDVDSMRTIIRALANYRRTTAWFGNTSRLTAVADAMVNKLDFQTAKEIAVAQLSRIPDDFRQRSAGEILKTIRIQNMLSSLTTVNRNLVGNGAMALVDGFSDSTVGAALDHLVSKVTNRREVSNDMTRPKAFMNAATEAAQMAALCAELDIPMDTQAKYPTGRTRTFSPNAGVVSRFFSAYEKYLKYGLEVTDSFFEGGAEATVRASLEKLGAAANLSDEDIHSIARQTAARRTFKDNRKLTRAARKAKDALNEIGTDDIGLGDFVIPFASVGSNVAHTAMDYSTGGLGGLYEIFTLMRDAKAGKTIEPGRQRKAVTDAARGITGLGLISVFAALASQGVLMVSNDKDWDKRGLAQAEGLTGTQLNLSAAIRALEGKDMAYQQGDILLGVDFMEPFNAQMRIGYLLSLEDSFADMLQAYPGAAVSGVAQALLDSPLMEGLSDVVDLVDGAIESAAAQEPTALVDAAGQLLGTAASGFIPAPVRQAAQVIDPFYRDTTGGNALEKAANQAIAQIPFASMTLPKKYSGLGEEQRRYAEGDELFAFFNTFIAPGKITQASPSEISGYLNELSEATGSVEIYPDYLAPKSFTFDGKTVEVSGKEMTEAYQRTYGENVSRIYSDLIATDGFTELSNDMQVTAIKKAKQYATDLARKAVSADYSKSWMEKTTGNEATSIISDVMCAETGLSETRYKAAAAAGMSVESMQFVADTFKKLKPEAGYAEVRPIQEYEAIVRSPNFNDDQEEAWLKVLFNDKMDQKLDTAQEMGYTSEMFVQAYRAYLDNDNRKTDTVQYIQEKFGVTKEEAEALYKLYKGTK